MRLPVSAVNFELLRRRSSLYLFYLPLCGADKYSGVPPESASVRATTPFEGQKPGTSGETKQQQQQLLLLLQQH